MCVRERERERERERVSERQTDRQTDRVREREREKGRLLPKMFCRGVLRTRHVFVCSKILLA